MSNKYSCPNCGAPRNGRDTCPYCGTWFSESGDEALNQHQIALRLDKLLQDKSITFLDYLKMLPNDLLPNKEELLWRISSSAQTAGLR